MTTSIARVLHLTVLSIAFATFGCSGTDANKDLTTGAGSGTGTGTGTGSGSGSGSGGGSASSDNDALFKAPSGRATADSVFGLWGGVLQDGNLTFDTRTRLTPATITFATQCLSNGQTSAVVGVTVAARVSDEEIAVLESKRDEKVTGGVTCRANAAPGTSKRCEKIDGFQSQCFVLDGMQLTIYGATTFDKSVLTKLSD